MLVVHYTGMTSGAEALDRLCDPEAKVSAHYLIELDGGVFRLVDEDKRAWHAGVAWWRGELDVNGRSVGIELVNPGHEFGYRAFPHAQMVALEGLAASILKRHPIPPRNVVGHSDVAPRRKQDPGERFDWKRLARAGVGLWVDGTPPLDATDDEVLAMLSAYGYEVADPTATLAAFQRHFRPARVDGVADAETAGILKALLDAA
ncbi:MAG: N-acetylmuramoyl-L-alanine amidase [Alphaproteobacteria bacterium]|nr:N-acetylmuramoyl-L-alanine amidase [Alphaproteobacteria bacterium]MBF0250734.1 N-acetylmuramoyl-L-alanine amidase [Alphaproteobacteria bacterium]